MEIGSRGSEPNTVTRDDEKAFNPELKAAFTQQSSEISVTATSSTVVVESEMRNESISISGKAEGTQEEHAIQVTSGTLTSNTLSAGVDTHENVDVQANASENNDVPKDTPKEMINMNAQVIVEENVVAEVVSIETHENNPQSAAVNDTPGTDAGSEKNKDERTDNATDEKTTDQSVEGTENAATLQVPETSEELPLEQGKAEEQAADVVPTEESTKTDVVAVDKVSKAAEEQHAPASVQQEAAPDAEKEPVPASVQQEAAAAAEKKTAPEVANLAGDIPVSDVPKNESAENVENISEEEIESIKGKKVKKKFGKKFYFGDVSSYDPEAKWFKVVYEDGDEEDLELDEVKQILVPEEKTPEASSKKRPRADGHETAKQSKKSTVTSTAKKVVAKTSIKSPKTPATKSKGTTKSAKSVAKSSKKTSASPKTPGESEETVTTKKTASKAVSSKKAGGNKVSRSLDLQTPITQGKEKGKTAGEKSAVKKNPKTPKVEKSASKRKPDEEGESDLKAKRPKKEEAHADEALSMIGKHVKKDFDGTLYGGEVKKYDKKTKYFKVVYEDGDEEELERHELDPILVDETIDVDKGTQDETVEPVSVEV